MSRRILVAPIEIVVALACLAGAVPAWREGLVVTVVAPAGDVPGYEATRYLPPWLLLATVAVVAGGILLIDAVARLTSRAEPAPPAPPVPPRAQYGDTVPASP
ncbi:hypothetical protein ACFYTF_22785 [Nocardia thailandica]|uniref:Uncharacterized protein n=1 Tax=Nocardia thailandica TaxID=257275 RepID=A0ABW6PTB4_9NOCA